MKHLRKYNESNDIDSEYITMCFINFIDEGAEYEDYDTIKDIMSSYTKTDFEILFQIFIDIPILNFDDFEGSFDELKVKVDNTLKQYTDTLDLIESAVEKVKIKYKDAYAIVIPESNDCISIEIRR